MDRDDILLAALAAGGAGATFSPVQVQKLFFLIDREAHHLVGGPHFNFRAYDYGPFDKAVYDGLDALACQGFTRVQSSGKYRNYSLTPEGLTRGQASLAEMPKNARTFISEISTWVRTLSFEQLVASIYKAYPDMKVNSVFRG
ncbi:hypothetical protein [Paracoccus marinaquae]|uniref:Antitoxin SocA-like Panacea domain-containing protein n=1 Tax=Paracoccus marinaquae TaxID=2841926 RepID=A0ABS6AGK3_9RHOB|nr:hypothetical protein [Paracoccus marinaquae]MBU3029723.1 hypothetical protein [Paracoccus marinaquae]